MYHYRFAIVWVLLSGAALANEVVELPLEASNCAIARALNVALPAQCQNPELDAPRGIVIRFDDEIRAPQQPKTPKEEQKTTLQAPPKARPSDKSAPNGGYFIHFAFDSTQLSTKYKDHLRQLSAVMQLPDLVNSCLRITGHTDASGTREYNHALSMQRALAVGKYLVQLGQITPHRILISAKGKDKPLPNIPASAPQQRRVEFAIKPEEKKCAY